MTRDNILMIRYDRDGEAVMLLFEGELIAESRFEPERLLRQWLEDGVSQFVIGCSELKHIDSAGLSILLGTSHRCRRQGGDLILAELNPSLNAIFERTAMERYFKIFSSMEEARNHFHQMDAQRKKTPATARRAED